ncbi:caspase family protein [Candidatus Omnitrophota bacterium]
MQQHIRPDTTDVFIYYSGYGITDIKTKHPYLIPSEYTFDKKEIMKECYPVELLLRNVTDLNPRSVTIILDTCFAMDTDPIDSGITSEFLSSANGNFAAIVAASPGETANRYHEFMHGLFTWRFVTSLNETLAAKNTKLTAGELFEMLTGGNKGISSMSANIFNGKAQHPQFFGNPEQVILEVK